MERTRPGTDTALPLSYSVLLWKYLSVRGSVIYGHHVYVTGVLISSEVLVLSYWFMLHLSVQSCGKDGHAAGSCSDDVCGLERTLQYPTHEDQHGAEHFPHLSDIMFKEIKRS